MQLVKAVSSVVALDTRFALPVAGCVPINLDRVVKTSGSLKIIRVNFKQTEKMDRQNVSSVANYATHVKIESTPSRHPSLTAKYFSHDGTYAQVAGAPRPTRAATARLFYPRCCW